MKAHIFDLSDLSLIIGFSANFKLVCGTNRIHEGATIWVLLFLVTNALASTSDSRLAAATNNAPNVVSVHSAELLR